ncbi:spore germination protein [Peribacillus asahii]|uniref:spore germination protein n=1 Tax=Peribacillus asahii TaxID=228899 RepID=UPI00207941B8|nr:spore germination protein [Peribacillus asahii]USK84737.1 spore germination protein [Peribacillus asahii]
MKFKTSKKLIPPIKEAPKKKKDGTTLNEEALRKLFTKCIDIQSSSLQYNQHNIILFYCTGLVNTDMLYQVVAKRLEEFFTQLEGEVTIDSLQELSLPSLQLVKEEEQATDAIFEGRLLFIVQEQNLIMSVDIADRPERQPEETTTEVSVKGPRDNFIENITVNYALIRKRLRTTTLVGEAFEIGKRSKTKVSLLYMEDIANQEFLEQIRNKLHSIDIDSLLSGTQLEELINDSPYSILPRHVYTGRPDFAVESLLNGRFVLLIDGISYAYITPVNLFYLLKSAEDKEYNYLYNSFERFLRVFGITIAAFLPGFWVALTAFHQNQLPLTLLATVIESRRGVPFPTSMEAILMLLLFELFREAGMRLPLAVGQTLSVVGGLIIGDAAIRAGLTSPAMLVVIAGSTVATFTLVNQSLVGTISLIRFFVIFLVSLFGFVGFFVSVFLIGTYVAKIRTFGVPYLAIATQLNIINILKTIFRLPNSEKNTRPNALKPHDPTQGEES